MVFLNSNQICDKLAVTGKGIFQDSRMVDNYVMIRLFILVLVMM